MRTNKAYRKAYGGQYITITIPLEEAREIKDEREADSYSLGAKIDEFLGYVVEFVEEADGRV